MATFATTVYETSMFELRDQLANFRWHAKMISYCYQMSSGWVPATGLLGFSHGPSPAQTNGGRSSFRSRLPIHLDRLRKSMLRKRVSALRRDRSVIASTMRCARVSSQHWSANFSHAAGSRRNPKHEWPSSNSSKAGIIQEGGIPVWTIAPPWNTKDGIRRLHDYESLEPSTKPGPLQTKISPRDVLTLNVNCGRISARSRRDGGTGRHIRLRGVWLTPCGFKSRSRHSTFSHKARQK